MPIIKEEGDLDSTDEIQATYVDSSTQCYSVNNGKSIVNHNFRKLPPWMLSLKTENSEERGKIISSTELRSIKQEPKDNYSLSSAIVGSSGVAYVKQEFVNHDEPSNIAILSSNTIKQEPEAFNDTCNYSEIKLENNENFDCTAEKIVKHEFPDDNKLNGSMKLNTTVVNDNVTSSDLNMSTERLEIKDVTELNFVSCSDENLSLTHSVENIYSNSSTFTRRNSSDANINLHQSDISISPNSTDDIDTNASSAGNPEKRMKCRYGGNCYRTNVQHKQQFSHPTDSDFDGDTECDSISDSANNIGKPNCWYGSRCYRKNEEHQKKYNHPSTSSLISKRKRKPNNVGHFQSSDNNDSDEYEDSFIDDNSLDEFQLSETDTEEQFSDFDEDSSSESENEIASKGRTRKKKKRFSLF